MAKRKVEKVIIADADYFSLASIIKAANDAGITDLSKVLVEHDEEYSYGDSFHHVKVYTLRDETDEEEASREAETAKLIKRREDEARQQYQRLKAQFES